MRPILMDQCLVPLRSLRVSRKVSFRSLKVILNGPRCAAHWRRSCSLALLLQGPRAELSPSWASVSTQWWTPGRTPALWDAQLSICFRGHSRAQVPPLHSVSFSQLHPFDQALTRLLAYFLILLAILLRVEGIPWWSRLAF